MMCMQKQRRSNWDHVRQTGEYIKVHKNQLLESVRGPQPDLALKRFYRDMSSLCSRPGAVVDPSHLNAIIGATAKAWTPAWACLPQLERQQARHEMHAFLTKMLQRLQPLLPDVGAREAANLLWASAQLGLNPDALVPGMTDSLAHRFMADMDAATGQGFANALVACTKLQLSPCQGRLFKAILKRLATADLYSAKFEPQHVANTLHSLAKIPTVAPSIEVINALCKRFSALLKSHHTSELPDAQSIANTLWSLSKLMYAPADELAVSIVGRMVSLCCLPGRPPIPQDISNVLLACAQLSVPVKQADIDGLASFLLSLDRQHKGKQDYANTAWSLAVLEHLRQTQFELLLDQLCDLIVSHPQLSQSSRLQDAELSQLYQALDWLQPPQKADTLEWNAWLKLRGSGQLGTPAGPRATSWGTAHLLSSYTAVIAVQSHACHQWLPHSCCTGAHWQPSSNRGLI